MKTIKTLLVVAGLLGSAQAMACDVYINVTNATGVALKDIHVRGPWGRDSNNHDLENGEDFTYHATGSMLTCHGSYWLGDGSADPYCIMKKADSGDNNVDMNSDGRAYFTILPNETIGEPCTVSHTK